MSTECKTGLAAEKIFNLERENEQLQQQNAELRALLHRANWRIQNTPENLKLKEQIAGTLRSTAPDQPPTSAQ